MQLCLENKARVDRIKVKRYGYRKLEGTFGIVMRKRGEKVGGEREGEEEEEEKVGGPEKRS